MIRICNNLYVGDENDCFYDIRDDWVVIHACKTPCHQKAVGYRGSLPPTHPNYLEKEELSHLYLNMVDMVQPLKHIYTGPMINKAMNFIKKNIPTKKILIHCNLGLSRSPALALIYLTKIAMTINAQDYITAKNEFMKLYPRYQPGSGLDYYLTNQWDDIYKQP